MCGRQDDAGHPQGGKLDSIRRGYTPTAAIAPDLEQRVVPSAAWKTADLAEMGPAACLATPFGSGKTDLMADLLPIDRIQPSKSAAQRHAVILHAPYWLSNRFGRCRCTGQISKRVVARKRGKGKSARARQQKSPAAVCCGAFCRRESWLAGLRSVSRLGRMLADLGVDVRRDGLPERSRGVDAAEPDEAAVGVPQLADSPVVTLRPKLLGPL